MSKLPPIPPEQRSFRGRKPLPSEQDDETPETRHSNIEHDRMGRADNLRQNLTPQRRVQDR